MNRLSNQEPLLPTFATVRLSIQTKNNKLKTCIGRITKEHDQKLNITKKKSLRKENKSLSMQLKMSLSLLVYSVLLNRINVAKQS